MITFDFDYYRPDSLAEAAGAFRQLADAGRAVKYYAGGTELISLARLNQTRFDAVIDLKGIPECNLLEFQGDKLIIGSTVTLTKIADSDLFPLLGTVSRAVSDHTGRDKITLGGNICGTIPYREAILPLLLADSEVVVAGESGLKTAALSAVFNEEIRLDSGEFLVQVRVDHSFLARPFAHIKRTSQAGVGYPLVTVAAMTIDQQLRVALSGLCPFPFRSAQAETVLNDGANPLERRVDQVMRHLPAPVIGDILGSAEYREFAARNALSGVIEKLGGIV